MKANKFIIFFLLKAIGLYAVWYMVYDLWLKKSGVLDNWIIDSLVYFTVKFLELFNFMIYVDYHKVGIFGADLSVFVGNGCNGLELFALFTGFIIIFPGNWKNKVWYIPLGIIVLHFFNVLRIIGLVFSGYYDRSYLHFNHKYTFTIIMYLLTFVGWILWVKYFSKTTTKQDGQLTKE